MKRTLIVAALTSAAIFVAYDYAAIADGIRAFAITSCSNSAACIGGANSGAGPGVSGTSKKSNGVTGSTSFVSTPSKSTAGVIGQDASTSGTRDEGVFGTSNRGVGVLGSSTQGTGGVYGDTFNPSETTGKVASGVVGYDASTDGGTLNAGVFGASVNGTGVVASSALGQAIFAQGVTALTLVPVPSSQDLLLGFNGSFANTVALDIDGNLHLSGEVFTDGSCSVGCAQVKLHGGKRLVAYHPREAAPSLEDFGTGRLVQGRATLSLDPTFAATLDPRHPYLVFLTPRGDSRGLYVTNQKAGAFDVRESQGGRSTLDFDYRIVGKPADTDAPRLPEYREVAASSAKAKPLPRLETR